MALRLIFTAALLVLLAASCSGEKSMREDWELVSPSDAGLDTETLARLREKIRSGGFPNLHGVVVARHGKMGFEEYTGEYGPAVRHYTASVSKSIGSILFGMILDSGAIKGTGGPVVNTPMYELLPDHEEIFDADPQKRSLLLRHVLTMSDGLQWDESTYPYSDVRNDWHRASASDDPVAFVLSRPFAHDPGRVFNYNGGMSIILSYLIQRWAGRPADEYAEMRLFKPLGIEDYEWERLRCGLTDTDGGLHLHPRDMAKLGQLYLQNGNWNGERIVSEGWVRQSSKVHMVNDRSPDYGFQWWCGNYQLFGGEVYTFLASGHGGQRIYVFPSLDMVAVIVNQVFDNPMGEIMCDAIVNRYVVPAARPSLRSPGPIGIDEEELANYIGRWGEGQDAVLITLTEGSLRAQSQGAPPMQLVPAGPRKFVGTAFQLLDVYFEFQHQDDGMPMTLTARFGFRKELLERSE